MYALTMNDSWNISEHIRPLTVVVGHYGAGKTNLALNLSLDLVKIPSKVQLVDLDVVNPYFRSSDYQELLEEEGIEVVAPNFAHTTLDTPSLSGRVNTVIAQAADSQHDGYLIIDAGGDDVGATALGRFSHEISAQSYEMWYVVNAYRNITQDINEAVTILREIEHKSGLKATGVINNSHLQNETTAQTVLDSQDFAETIARKLELPLMCTTLPNTVEDADRVLGSIENVYPIKRYVRTSWDM